MYQNQNLFVCDHCKRTFTRKYNLQAHIENCHTNASRYCEVCDQRFGSPSALQLHLARGHNRFGQPLPECDLCGRIFTRKQNVTSHMITVHLLGARPDIKCRTCQKTFTTERNLKRHNNQLHNPHAVHPTCDECKRMFKCKQSLIAHILSTHRPDVRGALKCKMCAKVYTNNRNLKRHTEMYHGQRGEYRCDHCPKVYTSNQSLRRHTKTRHDLKGAPQLNCQGCSAVVFGAENINRHVACCRGRGDGSAEPTIADFGSETACSKCDKRFDREPLLRHHVKTEHSFQDFYEYCKRSLLRVMKASQTERRHGFGCECCRDAFVSVRELREHMRAAHGKDYRLTTCNVCYSKFYSKEAMVEHGKVCLPPPDVNTCAHCDKLFTDISSLEFHTRIFHPQGRGPVPSGNADGCTELGCYKCAHCDRVYYSDRSLKHHVKLKHTAEQAAQCQFCGKVCGNKYYLASHVKIVHTAATWSKCDYCDKQFKSKRNIRRHIEYTHLGMQRYKCIECDTLFKEKRSLRKHVRIKHPSSTLFPECHMCRKLFESAKSCKIHMKLVHSFNVNTHPCDLCSVSFDSIDALNDHLQTDHSAEDQIYKCEECNLVFKGHEKFDNHNGVMHFNLVSNTRHKTMPRCVICIKDFSSRKTLKRHIKKFHEDFDVEELANYGWLVRATSVECDECIKTFNDDAMFNSFQETKHTRETVIFKCHVCTTSYNALEYAVLRYKLVDACRGKLILSELCTAEMSDGGTSTTFDASEANESEVAAFNIKIEPDELLYEIKTEPVSP